MKQKLLFFFLCAFSVTSMFAQVANQPNDLAVCDDDNDGFALFDLTILNAQVLGSQSANDYTVTYHETQTDAENNVNPVPSPYANIVSGYQTIYIRVEDNDTQNAALTTVNLIVNPVPMPNQPTALEVCDDDNDQITVFDLTINENEITGGNTNMTLSYYESQMDAEMQINQILMPTSYSNIYNPQTIYVRVENVTSGCYAITLLDIFAVPCVGDQNVIVVENAFTTEELVTDILVDGDCSPVFNITYSTGSSLGTNEPNGIGYFTNESDLFPFEEGIVISTGHASSASGPNDSVAIGGTTGWQGDADLEAVTGINSFNATVIEFDFIPIINEINFEFLMASEEYDGGDFECQFSDAFAFLLTDANGVTTNLAVIPGTEIPISVGTIHPENDTCPAENENYFGGYTPYGDPPIAFNGRTVVFNAQSEVNIGEPYHIKLVIADAGDAGYDSAVFFNAASFDIGELCDNIGLINVKAFNDANTNGLLDTGETDFTNGFFTYEKNNDGEINYVNTSIGNFSIIVTNETDSYDISFNVYDEDLGCYTVSTATINNLSANIGDITTVNFPVLDTQSCEDVAVYLVNQSSNPRPGFDHSNLIILENLSSFPISAGTIEFTLDDALTINNVNLNPNYSMTTTDTGFTIDFLNLEAGASEIIEVNLNCPATIELGELVTNTITYVTSSNDVFDDNNTSQLSEIVIGSYDPNDKMESHGKDIVYDDFVTSDEFLYYTIRFQNVGTAEAIFVRIEDVLDSQLDESSFQMLRSSHDYQVTRTGNSLEWYFDDINLPAEQDDAEGSNGYVYFKIKPNPGYAIGDIIENTASIYFDYNAPIITNTFQTEFVETLSVAGFDLTGFTLLPNPAKGEVTIQISNSNPADGLINIYNIQGKMILKDIKIQEQSSTLDISILESGLYFVELTIGNAKTIEKLMVTK
ncbi:T9SS type A sorting domain-containing protein [Winogradskyella eckloniae]|uniref:DUF7619 domain-containing protein n=1 Tax=Winogradskyella eckloniae TaxID=1089306 RepID=UPI0015658D8A|nr:choice-of-anchor L domain-containing protein [Winogradskyella eckloniae]NRD19669.1 T9SS type A sorting domain-containing protein [Winogradskyella eckloniae]